MKYKFITIIIGLVLVTQAAFTEENEYFSEPFKSAEYFESDISPEEISEIKHICQELVNGMNQHTPYNDLSRIFPVLEDYDDYESFTNIHLLAGHKNTREEIQTTYQSLVEHNQFRWIMLIESIENGDPVSEFLDFGLYYEEEDIWYIQIILNLISSGEIDYIPVLAERTEEGFRINILFEEPYSFSD